MGLSSIRALGLALFVLACIVHCSHGSTSSAAMGILYTTTMSYSSDPALTSGGVFYNLTGAESQVFMWTMNPSTPYLLSWPLDQLMNSSQVPMQQLVNGSVLSDSSSIFRFNTAATDGTHMYLVATNNVFKVDPTNIEQVAPNVTFSGYFADPATCVRLHNATSDVLILSTFGVTDLAVVDLLTFSAPASTLVVTNPGSINGAVSAVSISNDTALLAYMLDSSIAISRISLAAPNLQPVPIFNITNVYIPNGAPMVYSPTENFLYMLVQNVNATKVRLFVPASLDPLPPHFPPPLSTSTPCRL